MTVVISQALALSLVEDTDLDPDFPIIGYHNLVEETNITAVYSADSTLWPVSNLANPATHNVWYSGDVDPGSPTEFQYLTVTTNYVDDIDYLAVAVHDFGTFSCNLLVEGSSDNGVTFTELVAEYLPANDDPLLFRWEPQSLSHVRLRIIGATTDVYAAVLFVGKLLVMPRGLDIGQDFTPITYARVPSIISGVSESGQFLGRIMIGESRESQAAFKWLEPDWYRTYFEPFAAASRIQPFFFAWSPEDYPTELGYCWVTQPIIPAMDAITQRMHVTMQMSGVTENPAAF